jgi:hypothetical protein
MPAASECSFCRTPGTSAITFRVTGKFIVTAKTTDVTCTMKIVKGTRTILTAIITTMAAITRALA